MHRALLIAEIRSLICTFAADQTLARLAQCCKDFHHPAIRVLWNAISNLSPLVRCFPPDAWTFVKNGLGRCIKLVRPLAPEDWTAFLKYSHIVRRFGVPSSQITLPLLQERVTWELSAYRPVFILFPNLVAFEWAGGVQWLEEELPVLLGFLNPNIVKICIANWRHDQAPLRSSISLIASRFTHLKDLRLVNATPPRPKDSLLVMPSILSLIRKSTTLEEFEFTHLPLAEDIFGALAVQRKLTRLAIRLPHSVAWSTINIPDVDQFPALQEITILSRSQDYIEFCGKASFPRVKIVQIRLADVPFQQNDLLRTFASLCAQFSASALKRLAIVMDDTSLSRAQLGQVAGRMVVRFEDLQLFFKFETLSHFKLSIASCYALDPAAYLVMAKAWPHLKSFELGLGEFCTHPNPPGIRDVLVPFAVHCPKLTSLGVRFKADTSVAGLDTSVAIANALPPGEPSTSPVYSLDCFDSPVARTPYVAALLALLFPKLRLIVSKPSARHTGHSWDEVQQYLPLFAVVREDGRREAAREMLQS